jgi:hypothetical protein
MATLTELKTQLANWDYNSSLEELYLLLENIPFSDEYFDLQNQVFNIAEKYRVPIKQKADYGLTLAEEEAIEGYTDWCGEYKTNPDFLSGIIKCPVNTDTIYRGISDRVLKKETQRNIWECKTVSSFSSNYNVAKDFSRNQNIIIVKEGGFSIKEISGWDQEEVILLPNKYFIKQIDKDKDIKIWEATLVS